MNSEEIKAVKAQIKEIEAEALALVKKMWPRILIQDFSLEEIHEDGVIVTYYSCGETGSFLVRWIAFDKGVGAWAIQREEEERERKKEILREQKRISSSQKESRRRQYETLKKEFEP